jgi:hypothetical protein
VDRNVAYDACVVVLLRSPYLKNLTEWHISGRRVSALSLLQLFAPDRAARWRSLLINADWDYRILVGLAACEGLERLNLYVPYGPTGQQVARALRGKPRLRSLTLHGQIGGELVRLLAGWAGLARLEKLALRPHPNLLAVTTLAQLADSPYRNPETAFEIENVTPEEGEPTPEQLFGGPEYQI